MPVVPSFWTSHQWLRELRRWHDERMVAVHFRLPDDEPVHVGRFGEAHRLLPAAAAARWVMDHPDGAQVVVARSIARRDVVLGACDAAARRLDRQARRRRHGLLRLRRLLAARHA